MDNQLIFLILGGAAALGAALYLFLEQKARLLRTRVIDLPGTLRFEANTFSIEVLQSAKQVKIHAQTGQWTRTPLQGGAPQEQHGLLDVTLPAAGLHIEVTPATGLDGPEPTGLYTITLRASDALNHAAQNLPDGYASVFSVARVPEPVARSFQSFANRIRLWAEKVEHRLKLDQLELERKNEEAAKTEREAQAGAEGGVGKDAKAGADDATVMASGQIETWRKAAGFTGTASEVSIDLQGRVAWFIDLTDDGRVTLHANKRTIHTSLLGAKFSTLGGELEISVRDEYWTEDDPVLVTFRLFDGLAPNERHSWKHRLEAARDQLDKIARIENSRGYRHGQ